MSCATYSKKKDCIQKSECDWELRTVPGKSRRKGFCVKQNEEERKKEEKIMSSKRCESKQTKKECAIYQTWPICKWDWDDDANTQSCRPEYGKRKKDGYEWNEDANDYVYNDELRKSEDAKADEKFRLKMNKKRKEKAQSQWFNAINRTKKSLKAKKNWKIPREKYKKWSKIKKQWDKISKSIKGTRKAKQNWKKVSSKLKLAPQLYNVKFDYNNLKHFPFFKSIPKDVGTINNASSPLDNVLVNKLITDEIATIDDFILLNSLLDPSISSKVSSKLYKSIGKSKERFITLIKICDLLMVDTESKLWKYLIEHYFNLVKHNPNVLKVMSYELYNDGLAEHIMENVINELSPKEIKHFNYKCDQVSGVEEWRPGCWKDGKWTCVTRGAAARHLAGNNSVEGTKYGPDHNKHNYGYNRTDLEYINGEGHKKCAKWNVDVASTSRTQCKHCGSKINIGTTRIVDISGERESNVHVQRYWTHESNFKNQYYHIDCLFKEFYINATTHNNVNKYGDILGSPEKSDNEGYSVGSTQKIGWSCSHNLIESPIDYKVVEHATLSRKRRKTTMIPKTNVPQKDIQKINNLAANLRKYRLNKCKNYDRVFLDLPNNKQISLGKYKKPDINSFKEPLILDTKVYLQQSYNYKRHRIVYKNTKPDRMQQIENLLYGTHHKLPDWITSDETTNKKLARDKGLKWDNNVKLWYLPAGTDLLPFMTWLPPSVFEIRT
jgi:hypothetical protein